MKVIRSAVFVTLTILALTNVSRAQHSRFGEGHEYARKPTSKGAAKSSLKPAEGASVKILAPTKGQIFKGDQVPIQFKLVKGKPDTMFRLRR